MTDDISEDGIEIFPEPCRSFFCLENIYVFIITVEITSAILTVFPSLSGLYNISVNVTSQILVIFLQYNATYSNHSSLCP